MNPSSNQNPQSNPPQKPVQQSQPRSPSIQGPSSEQKDLNPLEQGCFQFFKVILYIYTLLLSVSSMSLINSLETKNFLFLYLLDIGRCFIRFIFVLFEIQAIEQMDFKKAKIALIGFVAFLILDPVYILGVVYVILGYLPKDIWISGAVGYVFSVFVVLIGSIKVYQFLSKNPKPVADEYQAV